MVEYFAIEAVPDKQYFRCERQWATLSTEACAKSWRVANHERNDDKAVCRCCRIGAMHAGEDQASMSPFKDMPICARCHRGATRLIGRHICVSCYNRQRELVIGRNAKGKPPVKLSALDRRQIRYMHGDQPQVLAMERSLDTMELVVAVLRDARKRVQFAFAGAVPGLHGLELF